MILDQLATTTVPFLRLVVQKGMVFDVKQNSFKRWEVKRNEMLVTCYCIILSVMEKHGSNLETGSLSGKHNTGL